MISAMLPAENVATSSKLPKPHKHFQKFFDRFNRYSQSQKVAILSLFAFILFIPVATYLSQQKTETRSRAFNSNPITPITQPITPPVTSPVTPPSPTVSNITPILITLTPLPATPTPIQISPTPIPTIPTIPTLVTNGSFEDDADSNLIPDNWSAKYLNFGDGIDSSLSFDRTRSFKFSPSAGKQEQISQNINISGGVNDALTLSVYNHIDKPITQGKTGVVMTIIYNDNKKETVSGVFSPTIHDWQELRLSILSKKSYKTIQIIIFNANRNANVRVDKVSLSRIPLASANSISQSQNILSPAEIEALK